VRRIWVLVGLLVLTGGWSAAAQEEQAQETAEGEEEEKPRKYKWFLLPNVAFDTDDGLGFGARAELQRVAPDRDPYVSSFVIQAYATLRGYHHHRFRMDLPGMGRQGRLRFSAWLAFRAWMNDGYWGMGNGTTRERVYITDLEDEDPRRKRYKYTLIQPFGLFTLRADIGGPLAVFGGLMIQYSKVSSYEGSLLEAHQPYGMDGGLAVQFSGGIMIDTREPELTPNRGVMAEVSARVSPAFDAGAYWGLCTSVRTYVPLAKPVVLASRVMAEWMYGDVPFYEMVRWGGSVPVLGFGGWETIRGVPFGRWHGRHKAVGNLELRIDVVRHPLLKQELRWQLVPTADVGAVWGTGEEATAPAPEVPLHPSAGVGIRLIWADAFVGRIDFSVGPDAVQEPDGTITQEPYYGFFLLFDHMF
jgi:hypothetical protein